MAQGGSGRPGGKAKTAGRPTNARGASGSSGRGSGAGKSSKSKQSAVAAQRAIKGASGRSGVLLRVVVPVLVVLVIAAVVIVGVLASSKSPSSASSTGLPANADTNTALLANTAHDASGGAVDGIQSNDSEQLVYHIHAHLAIYVNGQPKLLPYGVGIVPPYQLQPDGDSQFVDGGSAFYWLHTHDETGVIHIESPNQHTYVLGNFFDIWGQTLSQTQVGPAKGTVTAFLNGKKFNGNPRNIPLAAHNVIQLDVGTVVPFQSFTFPSGL